jgi:hypothetical protein
MSALAPWQRWLSERWWRLTGKRSYLRWIGPVAIPRRIYIVGDFGRYLDAIKAGLDVRRIPRP